MTSPVSERTIVISPAEGIRPRSNPYGQAEAAFFGSGPRYIRPRQTSDNNRLHKSREPPPPPNGEDEALKQAFLPKLRPGDEFQGESSGLTGIAGGRLEKPPRLISPDQPGPFYPIFPTQKGKRAGPERFFPLKADAPIGRSARWGCPPIL